MNSTNLYSEGEKMSSLLSRAGIFCLPVADPHSDDLAQAAIEAIHSDIAFCQSQGFGFAWIAEHHNTSYGGCIPDPLTFIAALGQRVPDIALGTAVLLAPLRHPVMIVEQARLVARLVRRPVHLGLGRGFLPCDQADFGLSSSEAAKRFWEAVTTIAANETHAIAPANVWVATTQPDGAERVGRLGLGLALNPYTRTAEETGLSISSYRAAHKGVSHVLPPRILIHEPLLLAPTAAEAREKGRTYFATYLQSLKSAGQTGDRQATEDRHSIGAEDYAARCPFEDDEGFRRHILSWLRRGVTHWCFQVRFGQMPDEITHETVLRCSRILKEMQYDQVISLD